MKKKNTSLKLPAYGISIENHSHQDGFQTKKHYHPCPSLLYIVSGEGQCIIDKQSFSLQSDNVIILKSKQQHCLIDSPGKSMTVFVIYFSEENIRRNLFNILTQNSPRITVPPYTSNRMRKLLRQMLHAQNHQPVLYEEIIQQCLNDIILKLARIKLSPQQTTDNKSNDNSCREVLAYIADNLYETFSLPAAAGMAKISQRQFTNICRKLTGKSFNQYINHLRISHASELLTNTDMPVTAIAFEVGYEDLSTFYRAFKRTHNISPTQYRKNAEAQNTQ